MLFIIILLLSYPLLNRATIVHCDFDVTFSLTNGEHSQEIDYDYTLMAKSGHYRYFNRQFSTLNRRTQITTISRL
ncbi:hypothetical protein I4U23_011282 [Adineta vaga]|nr:hypothetical protein I4U23_011282 [Adineta vaga]